ncbi:hypothetical protein ACIBI9_31295 [Nonomuraea sp. NPDC050451]|uniref:hypothetical protein n=1 Tax=Nonomuraea sp. NPDC050451 TaxID=3364364 RepID=UPI00379C8535
MKDFGDVVIYLGAVAAALAAIAVVFRFAVLNPWKRWTERLIATRVTAPLDKVHNEVSPNGGGSMKDQVNRIELKVNLISERLDRHLETHTWKDMP